MSNHRNKWQGELHLFMFYLGKPAEPLKSNLSFPLADLTFY